MLIEISAQAYCRLLPIFGVQVELPTSQACEAHGSKYVGDAVGALVGDTVGAFEGTFVGAFAGAFVGILVKAETLVKLSHSIKTRFTMVAILVHTHSLWRRVVFRLDRVILRVC